ncbi:MAG: hypothetical protein OEY95_06110 [Candidatus Bathyarchaeota archaeon]|nr:hypothetical protein [Candidatus Bathyarchaeota archaeon]
MQNKKILSTLIIALLAFSMIFAFIPMASAAITATLDPPSGPVGTSVKVSGENASLGGLVEVYWETTAPENLLNTTYATGAGIYECNVTIPADVQGDHFVIVKDVSTGSTTAPTFTIASAITLTPTSGIPEDSVDVAGTGFAANSNITLMFMNATAIDITPTPQPKTDSLGSFSATFEVPTVVYATYNVNATDETPNTALANFTVGATITLTPDEGPTGKVVAISGRGFTETADLNVTITVAGITAPQVAPIKTKVDGTFTGQFIVPTVAVAPQDVNASDGTTWAITTFNVTKTTTITLNPTAGQPNWSVTIEGVYFTAIAGTEVKVKFQELTVKTLYTNATGGFKGTFIVPSFETGSYIVNATDENGLKDTAGFTIAITLIFLTPSEGPTGTNVTIAGYGFTKTTGITANVTIGTLLVKTGIPVNDTTGRFTATFIVPTLPAATYEVTAIDSGNLTAKTSFTVTKSTELIITPSSAYPEYTGVSIVGNYFSGNSTVDVVLYNATYSAVLGNYTTFANGTFTGTFNVPDIDLGNYFINATDTYLFPDNLELIHVLEIPFSIVKVVVQMETRASKYLQGDIVSFYIKSDLPYNITIEIKDPTNYPYGSISITTGEWVTLDDYSVVPYNKALVTLPSDAKTGTWNWTATIGAESETGTFTVETRPTLGTIVDLITGPDGVLARIDTAKGEILVELADIDARITSIEGSIATIETDVGTIKTDIATINLKVVAINGTVATIKTDLGTMQGTVTSIDGNVATIKTDVGTVKADVSDIVTDVSDIAETGVTIDLTPVWIAVAFSILAFLAAIVTVYMLRSKLA